MCSLRFVLLYTFRPLCDQDTEGRSALHISAANNLRGAVYALLLAAADVDSLDNNGCTALLAASSAGALDCTKILLAARADVSAKNKDKVWIKYNRGSHPGLQRPIAPIGWSGYLLKALCLQTGIEKKWRVDRIMDLTTAEWGWADAKASSDAEVPGAVAPPGEASDQATGPVPESAAGAMDCAGGAAEEKGKPQLSIGDKA